MVRPCAVSLAVTFVAAWLLLWLLDGHVLRRCEELSLYLSTSSYWSQCMSSPGGLVDWLSTWLTQYLYQPCLGALVYAACLTLLQWLIVKAFGLKDVLAPFAAVVPMMLLCGVMSLGYEIYATRTPGIVFSPLVGTLFVVILTLPCCYVSQKPVFGALYLAILPLLYPLLGAYALIAVVICVFVTIIPGFAAKRTRTQWILLCVGAVVSLLLAWGIPQWWIRHVPATISLNHIYQSGLPALASSDVRLWMPYAIAAVCLLALTTSAYWRRSRITGYVSVALAAASLACAVLCRNSDGNFHATVKMQLALEDQDYNKAWDVAQQLADEPTRLNVMLREAALNHLGLAGDYMYAMPNGAADYDTSRGARTLYDAGSYTLAYHMGRLNYAYRWAMEYMVEYGPKVDYLKMMAKCALLNNEPQLAKKHLEVLAQTRNHRDWALKYYRYLDDPEAMLDDAELRYVDQLAHFDESIALNTGTFEPYLRPVLAKGAVKTTEALDLALQNCLNTNQVSLFAQRLSLYAPRVQRLPRHYQEVALMADQITGANVSGAYEIDPQVRGQFEDFVRCRAQYSNLPIDEQRRQMEPLFGKTYWYFFVYVYPYIKDKMI